jgi:cobalt transporter subunit CbtB
MARTFSAIVVPVVSSHAESSARRMAGLMTLLCGAALIFLVGFSSAPALHNGTHDTRHANGFPCH